MNITDIGYTVVFTTLAILLLIAASVIVIFIASRQRDRQQTALTETHLAYESELRTIESEVQEVTLTHIAAELHDNIGQLLTFMNLQMEKVKLQQPTVSFALNPISNTLQTTIEQVRLLSHSFSNDFVIEGSLSGIITQEVQRIRSLCSHDINFESDGLEPIISKDMRIVVFRILQEALNNTLRHANATEILIHLQSKNGLFLQFRDNGIGYDKELAFKTSHGFGLKNMMRRAILMGLKCTIETAPQMGCTISISST